jgi:hypothetical protein
VTISETKRSKKRNCIKIYSRVKVNERDYYSAMLMICKSLKSNITYWNESINKIRLKLSQGYLTVPTPIKGEDENN